MDNRLIQKMAMMLSKVPQKDLEKNIEVAKNILANSKKEDLNKFINSKEVEKILGNEKENITKAIQENDINTENINNINNFLSDNT